MSAARRAACAALSLAGVVFGPELELELGAVRLERRTSHATAPAPATPAATSPHGTRFIFVCAYGSTQ
jgi:hypothetical protein